MNESQRTHATEKRRKHPRQASPEEMQPIYISVPQIVRRYGLGRSTFYQRVKEGKLPKPVRLGGRMSRWDMAVLDGAVRALNAETPH